MVEIMMAVFFHPNHFFGAAAATSGGRIGPGPMAIIGPMGPIGGRMPGIIMLGGMGPGGPIMGIGPGMGPM